MAKKKHYKDYVNKEVLTKIQAWRRDGKIEKDIFKAIGVGVHLANQWKKEHKEFSQALKKGLNESLMEVENAFYKRALGYYITEEEVTEETNGAGDIIKRTVKKKKRFIWSDANAKLILVKRNKEKWGETKEDTQINIDLGKVLSELNEK